MPEPRISRRRLLAASAGSAFTSLLATLPGCGGGSKRDTGPGSPRWQTDFYTIPFGYSESGLVYVWHNAYPEYKQDYNAVVALDNATGRVRWSAEKITPLPQVGLAVSRGNARSTVFLSTIDIHQDSRQTVYGLDGETGAVRWQAEPIFPSSQYDVPVVSCPLQSDVLIIAYFTADRKHEMRAYNGADGSVLWIRTDFLNTPYLVSVAPTESTGGNDNRLFIVQNGTVDLHITTINPQTGVDLTNNVLENNLYTIRTGTTDGTSFYTEDYRVTTLDKTGTYTRAYDLSGGKYIWERKTGSTLSDNNQLGLANVMPAIATNGLVVIVSGESDVFNEAATLRLDGLEPASGNSRWTTKLRGFSSACVVAGHGTTAGLVFCLTSEYLSNTLLYACDAETGEIRWSHRYPYYILEPPYVAPDGSLYIKPNGLLAVRLT